jgi:hypothetical protein
MLALVVRYRLKIWSRSYRSRGALGRLGGPFSAIVYVIVCLSLISFGYGFTRSFDEADPASVSSFLVAPLGGMAFLTLLYGIGVALGELFVASDVEFLLSTPLASGTLFLLKLFDSARPAAVGAGWALSALVGYGLEQQAGGAYYASAVLAVALLALLSTLFSFGLVLLLARLLPAKRLREAVLLAGSLVAVVFWIAWSGAGVRGSLATGRVAQVQRVAGWLRWTPVGWAQHGLGATAAGRFSSSFAEALLLVGCSLAVAGVVYLLFLHMYLAGWSGAQESGRRRRSRAAVSSPARPHSAAVSIAIKDWRSALRDVAFLSTLLPTAFYAVLYPFLLLRIPTGNGVGRWFGLAGLALVPLMAASTLSLTAVSREGHAVDVLRGTPLRGPALFAGKLLSVAVPIGVLTAATGAALALYHHLPAAGLLVGIGGGIWLAAGCSAVGVAIGAVNPNFEPRPGRRQYSPTGAGCVLYALIAGLFCLGSTTLVAVLVAAALGHARRLGATVSIGLSLALFFVALSATAATLIVGALRLEALLGPQD